MATTFVTILETQGDIIWPTSSEGHYQSNTMDAQELLSCWRFGLGKGFWITKISRAVAPLVILLRSQKALDFGRAENQKGVMLDWVKKLHHERKLNLMVDKDLRGNFDRIELEEMV
ncbi:hypothetical protein D5086_019286 [Populus alba]|uniref:Uncharacterized protein n=1 Tax=Populus alba TaxID=43335 RepID=A0ACC4BGU5_POPAL